MTDQPNPIPQTNPKSNYGAYRREIAEAIERMLESGWYILGKEVETFEQEFAQWLGLRHVVGVNSGTDAIFLALRACGVGPGDAVLTVSHTAVATVAAIEMAGARPILVDIDPSTYTMSSDSLNEAIAKYRDGKAGKLKAVIVVHLYGCPADMAKLAEISRENNLLLIEDCAQSHGAKINGAMTGSFGSIAAYSFYPTKNLGALGDGGAVATNDAALTEKVRLIGQYGWRERYISEVPGVNSRLDEMQAAILRVKLRHLNEDNAARGRIAAIYDAGLAGTEYITPTTPPGYEHVYHQYVIRTKKRDALRAYLKERQIGTLIHYPAPVHLQPAYRDVALASNGLKHTEAIVAEILSLPMYPQLSDSDARRVVEEAIRFFNSE